MLETNPVKIFHENDFPSKTNPSKITVSQKRKPSKTFAKNKFRRKSPSKNCWSKTNPVKIELRKKQTILNKTSVRKITRQNLILLKTYNVSWHWYILGPFEEVGTRIFDGQFLTSFRLRKSDFYRHFSIFKVSYYRICTDMFLRFIICNPKYRSASSYVMLNRF